LLLLLLLLLLLPHKELLPARVTMQKTDWTMVFLCFAEMLELFRVNALLVVWVEVAAVTTAQWTLVLRNTACTPVCPFGNRSRGTIISIARPFCL
jgi:hypothetical protein